jgi:O-antigen ligase
LLNHPQAYGVFLAPFGAWLTVLLLEKRQLGFFYWALVAAAVVSLFLTQSRTGGMAFVGAVFISVAWNAMHGRSARKSAVRWGVRLSPFVIVLGVALAFKSDVISEAATEFVLKGVTDRSVEESFYHSRGRTIELMINNFIEHPLTGIGFGVASNPHELEVNRDPYFDLPIGAS